MFKQSDPPSSNGEGGQCRLYDLISRTFLLGLSFSFCEQVSISVESRLEPWILLLFSNLIILAGNSIELPGGKKHFGNDPLHLS